MSAFQGMMRSKTEMPVGTFLLPSSSMNFEELTTFSPYLSPLFLIAFWDLFLFWFGLNSLSEESSASLPYLKNLSIRGVIFLLLLMMLRSFLFYLYSIRWVSNALTISIIFCGFFFKSCALEFSCAAEFSFSDTDKDAKAFCSPSAAEDDGVSIPLTVQLLSGAVLTSCFLEDCTFKSFYCVILFPLFWIWPELSLIKLPWHLLDNRVLPTVFSLPLTATTFFSPILCKIAVLFFR